jgi:acyl carrier protein
MPQIEQSLREFLRDSLFLADADALSDDDSFLDKGIVDSMGILHLVSFVHETYGISVADDELITNNWDSVRRIGNYVRSKLTSSCPVNGAGGNVAASSAEAVYWAEEWRAPVPQQA